MHEKGYWCQQKLTLRIITLETKLIKILICLIKPSNVNLNFPEENVGEHEGLEDYWNCLKKLLLKIKSLFIEKAWS